MFQVKFPDTPGFLGVPKMAAAALRPLFPGHGHGCGATLAAVNLRWKLKGTPRLPRGKPLLNKPLGP